MLRELRLLTAPCSDCGREGVLLWRSHKRPAGAGYVQRDGPYSSADHSPQQLRGQEGSSPLRYDPGTSAQGPDVPLALQVFQALSGTLLSILVFFFKC